MRQKAWPALMGTGKETMLSSSETSSHEDLDLMRKDVQRSDLFRSEAVSGSVGRGERRFEDMKKKLLSVLDEALSDPETDNEREKPCYYQGLHGIAFVLLFNLNWDETATVAVLRKLLKTHLHDASRKDFSNVTFVLDSFLMPLIYTLDPAVYQALVESDVPLNNAVLPWLITLFTHSVQDGAVAGRLMDAFLAETNPMLPFYVAVALLVHPTMRHQILEASYDPVMMHLAVHSLPGQMKNDFAVGGEMSVTAQEIIDSALQIMHQHPPKSLFRFLGPRLSKRSRRKMLNKTRRIAMLQIPAQKSTLKHAAQRFLREHADVPKKVLRSMGQVCSTSAVIMSEKVGALMGEVWCTTSALCNDTKAYSSTVVTATKTLMSALQVLVLFILMPDQYVKQFYFFLQGISGGSPPPPRCNKMPPKNDKTLQEEEDLPGMIKSHSTLSLSGMNSDKSSSELGFDDSRALYLDWYQEIHRV